MKRYHHPEEKSTEEGKEIVRETEEGKEIVRETEDKKSEESEVKSGKKLQSEVELPVKPTVEQNETTGRPKRATKPPSYLKDFVTK